jgi:glyoxylase-like metal-dependent hydrolase (beta-lactamase superfamily II)
MDRVNSNVYLLIDDEELTVVDTGMPKNAGKILSCVGKINRQLSDISKILLTQCRIDHLRSAYELKRIIGARRGVLRQDANFLSGRNS